MKENNAAAIKTEFYDTAVRRGYYGLERSGLVGKKDNARKYWEDVSIKLWIRPIIEAMLEKNKKIRIVDLGCGSGEGYELITHIPVKNHIDSIEKDFLVVPDTIREYIGLDISQSMIEQGRRNYSKHDNVLFEQHDLSEGLPLTIGGPSDLYFSSYASLSHLSLGELSSLTEQVMLHVEGSAYMVYDLLGKYSPEWPLYWNTRASNKMPYNMAYLYPEEERTNERINTFPCSFWSPEELCEVINAVALKCGKKVKTVMHDRSIFIGRHMDTGIFNNNKKQYRYQVNRLFDRDFRGVLDDLLIDMDYTHAFIKNLPAGALERINHYMKQWNYIIAFIESLLVTNKAIIHNILTNIDDFLVEDLEMISWLYKNASRFPVADFWASIMGPQIACVLRNCELNYKDAFGCGHGLFCVVEVTG
jgi:SAM-dependent methyltransferase